QARRRRSNRRACQGRQAARRSRQRASAGCSGPWGSRDRVVRLSINRKTGSLIGWRRGGSMSLLKAKRDTDWIGCIDFGTALCKVAMVKRKPRSRLSDSDIVPLPVGAREGVAVRNPLLLPSLVFVTDDGRLLFGDEAQPHADRAEWIEREAFVSPKQYL